MILVAMFDFDFRGLRFAFGWTELWSLNLGEKTSLIFKTHLKDISAKQMIPR